MFREIYDALKDGEKANLILERKGDELCVSVVPIAGDAVNESEPYNEDHAMIRAGLASPRRLQAAPDALDDSFVDNMKEFGQLRQQLHGMDASMEKLRATAQKAKAAVDKAEKESAKKGKSDKTDAAKSNKAQQGKDTAKAESTPEKAESKDTAADDKAQASKGQASVAPAPKPASENPSALF